MIISIDIGIRVPHWDMSHYIRIHESASSHDNHAMSSHMPRGPLTFIFLVQLDVAFTHALFALLGPHVGVFIALVGLVTIVEVVTCGYLDLMMMLHHLLIIT
jgi:hypothetical protein